MRKYSVIFIYLLVFVSQSCFSQTKQNGHIITIAHRGGIIPGYPENTLSAYKKAIQLNVNVIEIDLRGTRDGEIVIIHDETVDRTTDGKGLVSEFSLQEIKQLDAGNGEKIPTYQEVLELVASKRVKLLLDIKVSDNLDKEKVVRLTEKYGMILDVIVGVRTVEDLIEIHQLNPNLRTLGFIPDINQWNQFIANGVSIVRLWPDQIKAQPQLIPDIHKKGIPVWTTAGNLPKEKLVELIELGVDGILHDNPEKLQIVLAE